MLTHCRPPTPIITIPLNSPPETKLTAALLLRVYQRAIDIGDQVAPGVHTLGELKVTADPDGYSIAIDDGTVTARLMFHNKIAVTGANHRRLALLRKRLETVLA